MPRVPVIPGDPERIKDTIRTPEDEKLVFSGCLDMCIPGVVMREHNQVNVLVSGIS
jgi:hypothetical protein